MDQPIPSKTARAVHPPAAGAVQWRVFLRALADEVDHAAGPEHRDRMLRAIGRRMAGLMPLPAVTTLKALETEMNDALEAVAWGSVSVRTDEAQRMLILNHVGLPRIGSLGTPPGQWLSAVLEGLYEAWFAQQPGSQPTLSAARVTSGDGETVTLRFGRT